MFLVRPADSRDINGAIAALGDAFAEDPLMLYLFEKNPNGVRAGILPFFTMILRARIALGMPIYVLQHKDHVLGAAMGNDTTRPAWPPALAEEWAQFENAVPDFSVRLAAYEKLCEVHEPSEDHYYLGVIGVHPSLQGKGAGKALLDAFCQRSQADAKSHGVYLDTSNPSSLRFYRNNGFELRGEGALDGAPLWCVYRPT